MTTQVHTTRAEHNLAIAEDIMGWAKIRHIPVVDDENHIIGLVTERGMLRASVGAYNKCATAYENRQQFSTIPIRDVMCTEVATIGPDDTIQAAATLMHRYKYGCLPVVGADNELLGILSAIDLLAVVMELDQLPAAPKTV